MCQLFHIIRKIFIWLIIVLNDLIYSYQSSHMLPTFVLISAIFFFFCISSIKGVLEETIRRPRWEKNILTRAFNFNSIVIFSSIKFGIAKATLQKIFLIILYWASFISEKNSCTLKRSSNLVISLIFFEIFAKYNYLVRRFYNITDIPYF